MPLCGFNQKMLDGIELFAQGLWDQAEKRSREDGIPLEDSLKQEIKEMDIFRKILETKKPKKVQGLHGVALLAQVLYLHALETGDHKHSYFSGVASEKEFFTKVDAVYYNELRPKFGPEEALSKLGEVLETL